MSGRQPKPTNVIVPNGKPKRNKAVAHHINPGRTSGAGGDADGGDAGGDGDHGDDDTVMHSGDTTDTDTESFYPPAGQKFAIAMRLGPK